nr:MAG TPA: hypothetical protein [Microviridae sp.]
MISLQCNQKKQIIMNTLMLLKHIELRIVAAMYFKGEEEAIWTWDKMVLRKNWEVVYLKERKPCGHRYQLTCTKRSEQGKLYSRDIICFSKKEAVYLKNKIERINQTYIFNIKKLY